ncbi:hypothetical protein K0M31_012650 [Melipona bicolor]|uniref:Uncharacterized protein n=1 Tax=Melipona bicolor TaxID=60889 RepID=A0AA40KHB4_9HYME|nr:hypothetical protein K0M31_012650 [Melipona bicolor]
MSLVATRYPDFTILCPLPGHANQFGQYQAHNVSDQCDRSRARLRSSLPADEIHVTIADRPQSNIARRQFHQEGRPPNQRLERRFFASHRPRRTRPSVHYHSPALIGERGRVKAALTRLKTFYDTLGEFEPVDSLQKRSTGDSVVVGTLIQPLQVCDVAHREEG